MRIFESVLYIWIMTDYGHSLDNQLKLILLSLLLKCTKKSTGSIIVYVLSHGYKFLNSYKGFFFLFEFLSQIMWNYLVLTCLQVCFSKFTTTPVGSKVFYCNGYFVILDTDFC